MKKIILLLVATVANFAAESVFSGANVGGFAEFRYVDQASTSAQKDSFEFNHAHLIVENSINKFDFKIDALWQDATATTSVEEAWIQWTGHHVLGFKAGRFVNSTIWNDNRYVTEHLSISAPQLNDSFIPVFSTGVQVYGDFGKMLDYVVSYGNGMDATTRGDNNNSKSLFAKVTWKLQDRNANGLWLSASRYEDTRDVIAGGVTARTNDYEAYQFETGFKLKAVNILASFAKSKEKDAVLGDIDNESWYIQPSITVGKKATLFVRWEDFGVKDVVAATDKETRVVGLNFDLGSGVNFKIERSVDDFDLANLKNDDKTLFSLGMKF